MEIIVTHRWELPPRRDPSLPGLAPWIGRDLDRIVSQHRRERVEAATPKWIEVTYRMVYGGYLFAPADRRIRIEHAIPVWLPPFSGALSAN